MRWLQHCFILFLLMFISISTYADWQVVPSKSKLKFTATQNGAPITGEFKSFSGQLKFDPNNLKSSQFYITVDTNSVSMSFKELEDLLKNADWLDVIHAPKATFKSNSITKINGSYAVKGIMIIHNKTEPTTVSFTLEEYSPTSLRAKGSATIKRTHFGIGKGEWKSTDEIKDDVKLEYELTAIKKD